MLLTSIKTTVKAVLPSKSSDAMHADRGLLLLSRRGISVVVGLFLLLHARVNTSIRTAQPYIESALVQLDPALHDGLWWRLAVRKGHFLCVGDSRVVFFFFGFFFFGKAIRRTCTLMPYFSSDCASYVGAESLAMSVTLYLSNS